MNVFMSIALGALGAAGNICIVYMTDGLLGYWHDYWDGFFAGWGAAACTLIAIGYRWRA